MVRLEPYRLTDRGGEALERWRSAPTEELEEVRDAGTLKLFFGGDPATLAVAQLAGHRRRLELCERLVEQLGARGSDVPRGWCLAL
ncbi:MAG TPA: hypothetical protein VNR42_07145, partial [Solirubrobacteraceae bacterium]|nr:hypothetical protein [Solirubrobacteraceae bacterium]